MPHNSHPFRASIYRFSPIEPAPNVDNAEHRAIAEPNTVLLGLVGSTVHGVTVDSADDRDEMGICIEPPEYVVGLRPFAQWVFRTQPEGARSEVTLERR